MDSKDDMQHEPAEHPAHPTSLSLFEDRPASDEAHGSGGSDDGAGEAGALAGQGRRKRRTRRVLIWTLVALLLVVGGGLGAAYWTADHYASSVPRIPDAFPTVAESAQPKPVPHSGMTFLLVGLDARSDVPTTGGDAKAPAWKVGAARSDTMMLMHLSADRKSVSVVSIARDTWVDIPGHGQAKINAAYSWGGPALMTETVQDLTGIRIDHIAVIDWSGFKSLTDAVGGVDITIPKTIQAGGGAREWDAGTHHMSGEEALLYVRERHGLPNGDLDRTKRQQNFLRALMKQTMNSGTLGDPGKLGGLLQSVGDVVSVDNKLSNGVRTFLLQDADGQTLETHSISAGLDYPGVGPEHAWLQETGRARYRPVTDSEAMHAFSVLCRTEGIIPAIESSHALAGALQLGPELGPDGVLLVNLSGRGDKDVDIAGRWFGHLGNGAGQ